jgi:hypothetical protein
LQNSPSLLKVTPAANQSKARRPAQERHSSDWSDSPPPVVPAVGNAQKPRGQFSGSSDDPFDTSVMGSAKIGRVLSPIRGGPAKVPVLIPPAAPAGRFLPGQAHRTDALIDAPAKYLRGAHV